MPSKYKYIFWKENVYDRELGFVSGPAGGSALDEGTWHTDKNLAQHFKDCHPDKKKKKKDWLAFWLFGLFSFFWGFKNIIFQACAGQKKQQQSVRAAHWEERRLDERLSYNDCIAVQFYCSGLAPPQTWLSNFLWGSKSRF